MHLQCLGQPLKHPLLNWTLLFIVSYGALHESYLPCTQCTPTLSIINVPVLFSLITTLGKTAGGRIHWPRIRVRKLRSKFKTLFLGFLPGLNQPTVGFLSTKFGHKQICSFIFCCRENQSSITDTRLKLKLSGRRLSKFDSLFQFHLMQCGLRS